MPQSRGTEMQHKRKKENTFCLQHKINPQWTIDFKGLINKKRPDSQVKTGFPKEKDKKNNTKPTVLCATVTQSIYDYKRGKKKTKKKQGVNQHYNFQRVTGTKSVIPKTRQNHLLL